MFLTEKDRALKFWALLTVLAILLLQSCRNRDHKEVSLPPARSTERAGAVLSYADVFDDRFGAPGPRPQIQRGLGSGVIITKDGYILTNHHVIDGAEEIRVELTNNRGYDAKVIGDDPRSDLAVLKIGANDLPMLTLGDSDRVRVGDVVLAVGNPLGIGQTVTAGIISAKGRTTGLSDGSFESFLQTDAPINQGNSGGALVDTAGEHVGSHSQIVSPTGGNIVIGVAIPSNLAKAV